MPVRLLYFQAHLKYVYTKSFQHQQKLYIRKMNKIKFFVDYHVTQVALVTEKIHTNAGERGKKK